MQPRMRVLMEPRGFIRGIEWLLAIIAFATTGGFSSSGIGRITCNLSNTTEGLVRDVSITVSYPFNLESNAVTAPNCTKDKNDNTIIWGEDIITSLEGDFSATSQWFVFVGVMAFLLCMAAIVFYVGFEIEIRQTKESLVTIADFVTTIIFAFLWLTAAASWAWGIGQIKTYGSIQQLYKTGPVSEMCKSGGYVVCNPSAVIEPDYSPLNASVAFAFLSFFVWVSNVWFVYKETPYHDDQTDLGSGAPNQQVPGNQM